MSDDYYIKLADPGELRRNLLESSKTVLKVMQRYEDIKHTRERKYHYIQDLRALMRETAVLAGKLRKMMPKERFSSVPKKYERYFIQNDHPHIHHIPSDSEIQALEHELSVIEERLSGL